MTHLHALALPLILALAALALAWSVIPAPRRSSDDNDEVERGSAIIMPEDRWDG